VLPIEGKHLKDFKDRECCITLWYAFLISALLAPREMFRTSISVSAVHKY